MQEQGLREQVQIGRFGFDLLKKIALCLCRHKEFIKKSFEMLLSRVSERVRDYFFIKNKNKNHILLLIFHLTVFLFRTLKIEI